MEVIQVAELPHLILTEEIQAGEQNHLQILMEVIIPEAAVPGIRAEIMVMAAVIRVESAP